MEGVVAMWLEGPEMLGGPALAILAAGYEGDGSLVVHVKLCYGNLL